MQPNTKNGGAGSSGIYLFVYLKIKSLFW